MTTTQSDNRPGGGGERVPTSQQPARHDGESKPAASATALRAADSAAWTEPVAIPSAAAILSTAAGTLTQGRAVAREAGRLARELLRISLGSSTVAPAKGDWRFADPTWR
jgi:hypothetical protein